MAEAELAAALLELALIVFAGCRVFIIKLHLADLSTGYVGMRCCG